MKPIPGTWLVHIKTDFGWNSAFEKVNNCLNTNTYSNLETAGGQSYNSIFNCSFFQDQS